MQHVKECPQCVTTKDTPKTIDKSKKGEATANETYVRPQITEWYID